jgi:hypothetical protein
MYWRDEQREGLTLKKALRCNMFLIMCGGLLRSLLVGLIFGLDYLDKRRMRIDCGTRENDGEGDREAMEV